MDHEGAATDRDQAARGRQERIGEQDEERMRDQNLRNPRLPDDSGGTGPGGEAGLHDMGGDIGPASIRGSNAAPAGPGGAAGQAGPGDGYAEPMGYMAGRDDEWPETAGSDEKAVGARGDEIEPHVETAGPSPHPVPPDPPDAGAGQGHGARPAFRARGPAQGEEPGLIDDPGPAPNEPEPGTAPDVADPAPAMPPAGEHVTDGEDWAPSDEDDPDAGSGRTDAADGGGYLPGEGTGRPLDAGS